MKRLYFKRVTRDRGEHLWPCAVPFPFPFPYFPAAHMYGVFHMYIAMAASGYLNKT